VPSRGIRSLCCPRADRGHAAVLVSPAMNSRRRMFETSRNGLGKPIEIQAVQEPRCVLTSASVGVRKWPNSSVTAICRARNLSGDKPPSMPMQCHGRK
jgi:hypothetical protein